MNQSAIFTPMFALLFLTLCVWLYMYAKRIPFLRSRDIDLDSLSKHELTKISPSEVANPSNNFSNLFEIPVLFYLIVIVIFVTGQVDVIYIVMAWLFVFFRTCHSLVHCLTNKVIIRFSLYLISSLAVWFMILRAALHHFGL